MHKNYSLGFMFSEDKTKVLLILKDRPEWQRGKLNGIGGKEEIDDYNSGMKDDYRFTQSREFKEETGIDTYVDDWELFCIIKGTETTEKVGTVAGSTYSIYCYKAFSDKVYNAKTIESKVPLLINSWEVGQYITLPHVNWLVPMALYSQDVFEIKLI